MVAVAESDVGVAGAETIEGVLAGGATSSGTLTGVVSISSEGSPGATCLWRWTAWG